jgi:hypothetical protein
MSSPIKEAKSPKPSEKKMDEGLRSGSSVISESDDAAADVSKSLRNPTMKAPIAATSPKKSPNKPRPKFSSAPFKEEDLPPGYKPNPCTVVLGRGKQNIHCEGNLRLKAICDDFLPAYSKATSKKPKSVMVEQIVARLKGGCPEDIDHVYVRFHNGKYTTCTEKDLREKITAYFRDRLHPNYKSSSKAKTAKRQRKLREERKANLPAPPLPRAPRFPRSPPLAPAMMMMMAPPPPPPTAPALPPVAAKEQDAMAAETLLMFVNNSQKPGTKQTDV